VFGASGKATMITTRRATAEDKEFLWILKVAAMRQYVEQVYGWDDTIQYDYFENNFHPEALDIIQYDGQNIGMYKLEEREESYYLSQIEITLEFQNKGIGSTIIQRIIDAVAVQGQPLRLQVLKVNPARRLYERLGFVVIGESRMHVQMEMPNNRMRRPPGSVDDARC
jgi:ribosomal protein S18 acetylase RimI-like enzyme